VAGRGLSVELWGSRESDAVRLPSGVRRFRPEDIEAMRTQMFSGFAPLRADADVVPVRAHSID